MPVKIPPIPRTDSAEEINLWYRKVKAAIETGGGITWAAIDKTGSLISDIVNHSHTLLTDKGTNTHAQIDTHVANTTIHFTQANITTVGTIATGVWQGTIIDQAYLDVNLLLQDGSRPLTANWDVGSYDIRAQTLTADSLTLGSVIFAGTNGVLSQDNTNLFWDDTNNRLGIGTAPQRPLHVWLSNAGTDPTWITTADVVLVESSANPHIQIFSESTDIGAIGFSDNVRNAGRIYYDHNNQRMGFELETAVKMILDSTGLGVGGIAPSGALHLKILTEDPVIFVENDLVAAQFIKLKLAQSDHFSQIPAGALDFYLFEDSPSTANKMVRVYGYPTGGTLDYGSLQIVNTTDDLQISSNKAGSFINLNPNTGVKVLTIKSGATQAGAGAAANELWKTASHATLPDNVVCIGV